jgi:hypothetical protein
MRKIFQKWTGLKASEESLSNKGLFKPIQSQDVLVSCVAVMKL